MKLSHVVESQQFDRPTLAEIFALADRMEHVVARGGTRDFAGRLLGILLWEPSVRTRFSFEAAMRRLGGEVLSTESAAAFSSAAKGETLEDTVRVLGAFCDVMVLRHTEEGAARRAAAVSPIPVINAGDGPGQHPTQALLDLYTMGREVGHLDGLRVALVGDVARSRTVRSLAYLLGKYDRVQIFFVSPPEQRIKPDIREYLSRHEVWFREEADLDAVLPHVAVIYTTRIDPAPYADDPARLARVRAAYTIDRARMERASSGAVLLHPLPRLAEIASEVDADPRAAYFRQNRYGLYVRMALLAKLLGGDY
jgi:aspartate carbamoyltransferase catalytic subunit